MIDPSDKTERDKLRIPQNEWQPWPGVQVVKIPAADMMALLDYIERLEKELEETQRNA